MTPAEFTAKADYEGGITKFLLGYQAGKAPEVKGMPEHIAQAVQRICSVYQDVITVSEWTNEQWEGEEEWADD